MLKKDIVALIEYYKNLRKSNYGNQSEYLDCDILEYEIPQIPEISEHLNILKKELEEIKANKRNALKYVEDNQTKVKDLKTKCPHPLIFRSYGGGFGSSFSIGCHCALCHKDLNYKFETHKNIVVLNPEYYDGENYERNYNDKDVYNFLINILKDKNDDDEIDLSKEFKDLFANLDIGEVTINGKLYYKEYKILIIAGTNHFVLNENTSLIKKPDNTLENILKCLAHIQRTRLTIFSEEGLRKEPNGYPKFEFVSVEDLQNLLTSKQDIFYDLIIDATTLFTYNLQKNQETYNLEFTPYKIDLKKYFPNSPIWHLEKIEDQKQFYIFLKEYLAQSKEISNDLKRLLLKK